MDIVVFDYIPFPIFTHIMGMTHFLVRHEDGLLSLNSAEGSELLDQINSCHISAAFPSTVLYSAYTN